MKETIAPVVMSSLASPGVIKRSDIVVRKGLFTLVNGHLTPRESMVEDLLFIRSVLDAAGIRFFLVRGSDDRLVLAVDWAMRKKLRTALAKACANEPFYSRPETGRRDSPTVLVAEGSLATDSRARAFTLYRPRIEPQGRLRYGASTGVRLELWEWKGDTIIAPSENALMRNTLPAAEATPGEVEMYGETWPTLDGMFGPHASDVNFDIDIVFSWVDGASIEWQRARAKRMESYVVGEGDNSEARFRQIDELKFALRSVHLFAPWIRNIYIVTDSPRPAWLDEHPRVTILRSEDFFQDPSVLPTHNSHAVESQLHHIEGLSEYFLYSNDDMFFGRPVSPSMFFSPGGLTKFIEAPTRIGLGESNSTRSGFENAARVNRSLLQEKFGRITTRHLEHAATPLRKSVLFDLEREFPEDFRRTSASAFRSMTDISVTNSLYHYYALMTGRAVVQTQAKVMYVDTTMREGLRQLRRLLKRRSFDFFCLNDGSFPEIDAAERASEVLSFLDRYFPIAAPWEKVGHLSGVDATRESQTG
ncbi:stealth family protein [Marisediminicola senii]|uniref:stealth family protein n=1 Tax=Marisediminicola senii TaxID=2711233 RepID=UPI0013EDFDE4|nr:stealth family protein [Marisediminicola senii]